MEKYLQATQLPALCTTAVQNNTVEDMRNIQNEYDAIIFMSCSCDLWPCSAHHHHNCGTPTCKSTPPVPTCSSGFFAKALVSMSHHVTPTRHRSVNLRNNNTALRERYEASSSPSSTQDSVKNYASVRWLVTVCAAKRRDSTGRWNSIPHVLSTSSTLRWI